MLSKLFHKKITLGRPQNILEPPSSWPESWRTKYFKEYPRFDSIPLPKEMLPLKNLKEVLEGRHSMRTFDTQEEITLRELSTILYYSAGIKGEISKFAKASLEERNKTKRFYPSGGSRYPLEVYIAIKRVPTISPGIYHYNILNHSLEQLTGRGGLTQHDAALKYAWAKDAAISFIISTVWDRNLIKYKDFGYNLIFLEAGHAAQNFLLVAESLGIHQCSLAGFDNQLMNELLDLYDEEESSIHMIVFGK